MKALLLFVACTAAAQSPFVPLESWKAAVDSADAPALAQLYSKTARVLVGKEDTTLPNEVRYWTGLKASGVVGIDPKLLEISADGDRTRLVLRVQAFKGYGALVASMTQVWEKQPDGWRLTATQRSDFRPDPGRKLPEPAKPNTRLYPEPNEAPAELDAAAAAAARGGKRILVVFGANWCYDCQVLNTTFHAKEFAPLVDDNFVVVHINVGDDGKDNNDLAAHLGVNLDKGIPALAVLAPDKHVIFAQRDGEWESTVKIGPDDIRAFLERWKPTKTPGS